MSDLFSDLHGLTRGEVEKRIADIDEQKRSLSAHITARKKERSSLLERVKAARAAMSALSPKKDQLGAKRNEIRQLQGAVNAARRRRDAINALIPLPYARLVERGNAVRARLTEMHPDNPTTVDDEITLLKEHMVLHTQAVHKRSSNEYHQTVAQGLERIGVLRQEISASIQHRDEQARAIAESNDHLKPADLSFKAIRALSGRIDAMLKELNGMCDHQRQFNREVGRLHAFIKHVLEGSGNRRGGTRHLEERVLSGETFGMEDLTRLVRSGGLDGGVAKSKKKVDTTRPVGTQPKRRKQVTPKRGQGRIGRADPEKRR